MQVVVTGISGFIGSRLAPALAARGHQVRGVARDAITDPAAYAGCDAIVHLANIAHGKVARERLWDVNVRLTRTVAEVAVQQRVRRMVYLSSIKASGNETRARAFDGSENPAPVDDYGRAKLDAEHALFRVSGLEAVVLRPPLVYGPGVKANFRALLHAVSHGWPLPFASIGNARSMIYVENLVDAIRHCLEAEQARGQTYLVCDAEPPLSTPELCSALARSLGRPARLFRFPPRLLPGKLTDSLEVDDSGIRNALGWKAPFSREEGLRATARWYLGR
jgi:nucleoside-diphosphate-sugar epimerase